MKTFVLAVSAALLIVGCGKKGDEAASSGPQKTDVDIQEWGQQVGDVMASIDEAGGSSGTLAKADFRAIEIAQTEERLIQLDSWQRVGFFAKDFVKNLSISEAQAASCFGYGFTPCASQVMVRNFSISSMPDMCGIFKSEITKS